MNGFGIDHGLCLLLVSIAFYFDARKGIIPNHINIAAAAGGITFHLISTGLHGLALSASGLLIGLGITYLLYVVKALAAGDVKFFAAVGAIVGAEEALLLLLYSVMVAAMVAVIIMASKKTLKAGTFPFMYAVMPAYGVLWLI